MSSDQNSEMKKAARIIAILLEMVIVGAIIRGLIQHGLPRSTVFWVSAIIEAGLGYLTYRLANYLQIGIWNQARVAYIISILIGAGAPLALYFSNIDFLKPAGSTYIIYFMVGFACNIFKPQPLIKWKVPSKET